MSSDVSSADRLPKSPGRTAGPKKDEGVRIFVIFDTKHDADLYALLCAQSHSPGYGFSVTAGSDGSNRTEAGWARVRRQIRAADQTIIICGEHTDDSPDIHAELLIAIDEAKPHWLLWGRRDVMCKKPTGATRTEGMYSWTRQIIQDQLAFNLRHSSTDATARSLRRVTRDERKLPFPAVARDDKGAAPAAAHTVQ